MRYVYFKVEGESISFKKRILDYLLALSLIEARTLIRFGGNSLKSVAYFRIEYSKFIYHGSSLSNDAIYGHTPIDLRYLRGRRGEEENG